MVVNRKIPNNPRCGGGMILCHDIARRGGFFWFLSRIFSTAAFLSMLGLFSSPAEAVEQIVLSPSGMGVRVDNHAEWLKDPSGSLNIQDVLSQRRRFASSGGTFNFGLTGTAYWIRIQLHNPGDMPVNWIYEVNEPIIDFVDAYLLSADGAVLRGRGGDRLPLSEKAVASRSPAFLFTTPAHERQELFVRCQMDPLGELNATSSIFSPEVYERAKAKDILINGIFFGALLVMFLYNLFIFFSVRDFAYLFYVAYLLAMACFWIGMRGFGHVYLWPDMLLFNFFFPMIMVGMSIIFAALFMKKFLYFPPESRPHRGLEVLPYLLGGTLILAVLARQGAMAVYLGYATAFSTLIFLYFGFVSWRAGYRPARYYTISWMIFVSGVVIFALKDMALLPYNAFTVWSAQLGGLGEMALLSFALGDRIKMVSEEKKEELEGRLRAERQNLWLAAALRGAVEGVVITDSKGAILYMNPAYEQASGYSLDEALGSTPRLFKSGLHTREFYANLWRIIQAGTAWRGNIVNRRKDGTLYEDEQIISPLKGPEGTIQHFISIRRDVTQETVFRRSRDYFTAVISHELRTPLVSLHLVETLLQADAPVLREWPELKAVQDALTNAVQSFDRIVNATSLVLADLAGDTASISADFPYIIIMEAVEAARASQPDEGRSIMLEADLASLPRETKLPVDRQMLRLALDEALSNAVKFTPDGKRVRVCAGIIKGYCHIEVLDEGEGIPADKLQEVFIPYFSLENPMHHSSGRYKFHSGGLGLGLTVIKLAVDGHNGWLRLSRRTDAEGMRLEIAIPLE